VYERNHPKYGGQGYRTKKILRGRKNDLRATMRSLAEDMDKRCLTLQELQSFEAAPKALLDDICSKYNQDPLGDWLGSSPKDICAESLARCRRTEEEQTVVGDGGENGGRGVRGKATSKTRGMVVVKDAGDETESEFYNQPLRKGQEAKMKAEELEEEKWMAKVQAEDQAREDKAKAEEEALAEKTKAEEEALAEVEAEQEEAERRAGDDDGGKGGGFGKGKGGKGGGGKGGGYDNDGNEDVVELLGPAVDMSERQPPLAVRQCADIYALSKPDRAALYRSWMRQHYRTLGDQLTGLCERYERVCAELLKLDRDVQVEILSGARVIGMTTTAVAKYQPLLQLVAPEIVVVEEAAEVLEAHIVTALTGSTKQLILIGDHQQLRPGTAVYRLATHYNLDVSLFERLVKNRVEHVTLQRQRRMRPAISKMISPIYPELCDHPDVLK
jgi:hypothetical protein